MYKLNDKGEEVLNTTDSDWQEAANKFSYLKDAETMRNMRNLVDYIINTQEQFFVNDKAYYTIDGKKTALANQPAT